MKKKIVKIHNNKVIFLLIKIVSLLIYERFG